MLKGNLGKVVSMANAPTRSSRTCWLHSRQESGEHRPVGINASSRRASFRLSRRTAAKQGINITPDQSLDPAAGKVDVSPRRF
jgi:hypothetical protein